MLLLDTSTLSSITSAEGLAVNALSMDVATLEHAVPYVPQAGALASTSATTRTMPTTVLPAVGVIAGVGNANVAAERAADGSPRSCRWGFLFLPLFHKFSLREDIYLWRGVTENINIIPIEKLPNPTYLADEIVVDGPQRALVGCGHPSRRRLRLPRYARRRPRKRRA